MIPYRISGLRVAIMDKKEIFTEENNYFLSQFLKTFIR